MLYVKIILLSINLLAIVVMNHLQCQINIKYFCHQFSFLQLLLINSQYTQVKQFIINLFTNNQNNNMQKQGKGSYQSKPIQSLSFEELFQMAEQKFDQLDNEEAEYFYGLAYQKNPFHQAVVMCYANVLKQNDKQKQAKRILQKSIKQLPNGTYKRYFQLGQIYNAVEAIKAFQTGINQALKHLKNPFKSVTPDQEIKRDVAQAYASIAQICMTDLIDEPQAQAKCIQALQKGKQADQTCIDVLLQTANYQLFKQNFEIAKSSLDKILSFVIQKRQQYDSQLLLQASKYYIQLDEFLSSQQLLQSIHQQQGNQSQIVYLLAYCTFKAHKYQQCEDYIQEYKDGENSIKDQEVQQAMNELIVELNKIRKKGHANVEDTNENQQMEEDQWMDVEDQDVEDQDN